MIIAIDGPAGSGKSSVAKMIALRLRFKHIDTGAMYRAVAWKAGELGLNLADPDAVAAMAEKLDIKLFPGETGQKILVDGEDVTARLKTEAVGKGAATVAAQARVREILVAKQRAIGKNGGVVMDGRDIGTVVFPEADRKFFLDADPRERGRRRYEELKAANNPGVDLEAIIRQVIERDQEDRNRAVSPLKQADDAVLVDTTHLAIEDVVQRMIDMILPP
jgi:cytidylate kinase